jgi:hypothetical protein
MTRRLVLTSALATVVLASVPAAASATFIPGPPGKVVWTSGRANSDEPEPLDKNDNNARLWVADYPAGAPVQVTTGPKGVQHRHPNWSPDHTRIVYAAGPPFTGPFELRILDLRTGDDTQFAPPAPAQDRPSWSPDGSQIAYGSNGDLWVKGVAPGSEPVQLTETATIQEERPVWSPDGNTLYYNRGVPPFPPGTRDLYKKSPVTPAGAETSVLSGEADEWQPALSPDGKTLCFTRGPMSSEADIYLVSVNGGLITPFAESAVGNINCVWSPDGSKIIYTLGVFKDGDLASRELNGNFSSLPSSWSVKGTNNEHFDGNADWATNFPPTCESRTTSVGVNQFTTIVLSCTNPDAGSGAEPPHPEPIEKAFLEIVSPPSHGAIGGITDDEKVTYTPKKDFRGTDTFTYIGNDTVSDSDPATVTINVGLEAGGGDRKAPKISKIKVSSKRWREGNKLAKISLAPLGTTISFKLSEKARTTLTFQRQKKRKGKKPKYTSAGKLSLSGKSGKNKVKFQGRLSRSKRLSPGTYRLVVSAKDAAGNRSKANGPIFTIVPK